MFNDWLVRRMMSGVGEVSPYPPDYVDDGRLWAYVTVPEDGTYRISYGNGGNSSSWTALEIDGTAVSGTSRDQYLTAGDHILKYTLYDSTTVGGNIIRGRDDIFKMFIIPSTVTTLGDYFAFSAGSHAKMLMDKTKITSIGVSAFQKTNIDIGDIDFANLQTIGDSGFQNWYMMPLYRIVSLGRVTSIPNGCFNGSIPRDNTYRIPATVTSIGDMAFYISNYYLNYICYATTPPTLGSQVFIRAPASIKVPAASVETYKAAEGWSTYANVITAI